MDFIDSSEKNPQFSDDPIRSHTSASSRRRPHTGRVGGSNPHALWPATEKFQAAAFRQLLSRFDLGGDRWVWQFAHGFPTSGILSQEGVSPSQTNPPTRRPTSNRFGNRLLSGLRKGADPLVLKTNNPIWGEDLTHVPKWWVECPREVSPNGAVACFDQTKFNFSLRFGGGTDEQT